MIRIWFPKEIIRRKVFNIGNYGPFLAFWSIRDFPFKIHNHSRKCFKKDLLQRYYFSHLVAKLWLFWDSSIKNIQVNSLVVFFIIFFQLSFFLESFTWIFWVILTHFIASLRLFNFIILSCFLFFSRWSDHSITHRNNVNIDFLYSLHL